MDKKEWTVEVVAWLAVVFTLVAIALFLSACGALKETAADHRQEGHFVASGKTTADSVLVYRLDSVFVKEKGDSVYIDRWHTEYRYRNRTDTLVVRDSVYVDREVRVTETVEVNRLTGWQNFQLWCGRILAGATVLIIVYRRFKNRLKT
jgi:hypothetical protein